MNYAEPDCAHCNCAQDHGKTERIFAERSGMTAEAVLRAEGFNSVSMTTFMRRCGIGALQVRF